MARVSSDAASMTAESRDMDELYAKPGHLVRRLWQIHAALFAEECVPFDLTSVQYAAIFAIASNPGVDATRLSSLIAFDRSTLGDVLERLEAKGLLRRKSAATDKRAKLLYLTAVGLRLLDQVEPAVLRVQERLLQPLNKIDRNTVLRLLTSLTEVHNDKTSAPRKALE